MKKIAKYIPINAFVSYLNSRKLKNDIDDYASRRMDAEKAFASMGGRSKVSSVLFLSRKSRLVWINEVGHIK